jgi:AraC-like DNA-binding protein
MNKAYNFITVNKSNGPSCAASQTIPLAEWVDAPIDEANSFDAEIAKVDIKDLHLPNFSVRISQGSFTRDAVFVNTGGKGLDLLGSCLFPKGEFSTTLMQKQYVESFSGTQNFKYDPNNEFRHRIAANTPFHVIHFSVSPAHFLNFFPENEPWADKLKTKINKGERVMGQRSASITLVQERILQNIIECPLAGKMATFMMEASIVQIMLLQLHALFQQDYSRTSITRKDIDIAHGAKEYLMQTFLEDHSLENLARHFGTNTNKLMTLFKNTFGKSLFEYISELKMDFARKLLQEKGRLVVEVARLTGYKNPNHFSTAFKKRFGISPSQIE